MLLKVVEKINWDKNEWNKIFDLISDFRNEFSLDIKGIDKIGKGINFNFGIYDFYFERNSHGLWMTIESNGSKIEFDKVFDYIFNRIK